MAAVGKQDAVSPQTVTEACAPRPGVFDPSRRDTVLDLTDLIDGRIDPGEFFAENYLTEGMRTLLTEGFRRLEGKSSQGVFKLTQAMGGGKTHNLLAFGLLARHPQYRAEVMGGFYAPDAALGPVRVVAFSGRESDAPLGVWGAIAEQLGQRERFNDYYAPLSAPGQSAWVNLLQGAPLLIMLDELPPYFVNAAARSIGNSDLSAVTTTALSNLLVAVGRDELRNVCVVISDLTATYGAGGAQIVTALNDLEAETGRSAMNLEPVRMNSDEFYHILRRRLFERLPDDAAIAAVAQAYGAAVREAKQMDVTNASPEQFAAAVKESYPFHPAIRDLYARFRENQGFQQTRGLIRLMRIVVARIWADDRALADRAPCLIAAHHLDLGSRETLTEINQINNTLGNAVAHDIASGGASVAERLDANLGGGRDAQDVMRLLLIASLANVPNAVKGLAVPEIVAYLCAPGRDVSRLKNEVIARLTTAAWYLHGTNDGRLHLRNVQNLNARVSTTARAYLRDQATREVEARLTEIFRPDDGACYQRLMPLPAVDQIDAGAEQVTLVVAEPHPAGLHPDLRTLYDQHTFRNRLCFLTGERAFDALLESARDLKAVNQIIEEMHEEGVADGDTQMQQAREQLLPRFLARFHSAIRETFTTLYYPTRDRLARVDFTMEFRGNRYDGEEQVREALAGQAQVHHRRRRRHLPEEGGGAPVHAAVAAVGGDQAARRDGAGVAVAPARRAGPAEGGLPAQGPVARGGELRQQGSVPQAGHRGAGAGTGPRRRYRRGQAAPAPGQRRRTVRRSRRRRYPGVPPARPAAGFRDGRPARLPAGGRLDRAARNRRGGGVDQPHHAAVPPIRRRRRQDGRAARRPAGADPLHHRRVRSQRRRRRLR